MKYVSLDLETTGLDEHTHQILEIGAIIEDPYNELGFNEIPKFHAFIASPNYVCQAGAAVMNTNIFKILSEGKHQDIVTLLAAESMLINWLNKNLGKNADVTLAGKNVGTFDIPFLQVHMPNLFKNVNIHRRVLDPGILFTDIKKDSVIPNLKKCLSISGIQKEISHDAVEDAWDVIQVLRKKY